MATASNELKNTTYEAFIGVLSVVSIVNIALHLPGAERSGGCRSRYCERPPERDFPRRLCLSVCHGGRGPLALLLPAVRLGGPGRQHSYPTAQDPACVPSISSVPARASVRRPEHDADLLERTSSERVVGGVAVHHPSPGVREHGDGLGRGGCGRTATSRRVGTQSGGLSLPSPRSAMVTSTR